jgi:hypothetical protein
MFPKTDPSLEERFSLKKSESAHTGVKHLADFSVIS